MSGSGVEFSLGGGGCSGIVRPPRKKLTCRRKRLSEIAGGDFNASHVQKKDRKDGKKGFAPTKAIWGPEPNVNPNRVVWRMTRSFQKEPKRSSDAPKNEARRPCISTIPSHGWPEPSSGSGALVPVSRSPRPVGMPSPCLPWQEPWRSGSVEAPGPPMFLTPGSPNEPDLVRAPMGQRRLAVGGPVLAPTCCRRY